MTEVRLTRGQIGGGADRVAIGGFGVRQLLFLVVLFLVGHPRQHVIHRIFRALDIPDALGVVGLVAIFRSS